jgi:transcriptional regulator with XRE-family HTH domain
MNGGDLRGGRGLDPDAALGAAIRTLRERAELSQAALGARAELQPQSISSIEAGQHEPTWGDLRRIARGLEVPLEKLLELVERLEAPPEEPDGR